MLNRFKAYIKIYAYYYLIYYLHKAATVLTMLITNEKRLYYLYSTQELVEINAFTYWNRVSVDNTEYALIKTATPTGTRWTKGERF